VLNGKTSHFEASVISVGQKNTCEVTLITFRQPYVGDQRKVCLKI
jgi:hypothetical protein